MKQLKYIVILMMFAFLYNNVYANNVESEKIDSLSEVTMVGYYRHGIDTGSLLNSETLKKENHGQEPSFVFAKMPVITVCLHNMYSGRQMQD